MKPQETYYENGNIKYQEWYWNGKLHREDGPAYIRYYENGNIKYQAWRLNGNRHRTDGPAYIRYYENGNIKYQEWYLNGKKLYKKDFDSIEKIKQLDASSLFTTIEIARMKLDNVA